MSWSKKDSLPKPKPGQRRGTPKALLPEAMPGSDTVPSSWHGGLFGRHSDDEAETALPTVAEAMEWDKTFDADSEDREQRLTLTEQREMALQGMWTAEAWTRQKRLMFRGIQEI